MANILIIVEGNRLLALKASEIMHFLVEEPYMSYNVYMLTREAMQFLNIVTTYDEYD